LLAGIGAGSYLTPRQVEPCHDDRVPDDAVPTGRVVVLAGPGVVDDGALDGLRAFADAGTLGVANTWGAKGAFAWDSPRHLGTCGLQERDFELLGWADVDAIVATGLDEQESPRARYALAPVLDVATTDLARLAGRGVATGEPPENRLYARLAAIARPGYESEQVPLHPARAVADLAAVLPPGGLLTAEPGVAGLWVARTFPTPELGPGEPRRVVVPARREPGIAVRLAVEAARAGRTAIAVLDDLDATSNALLADADRAGTRLTVVIWAPRGRLRVVEEHRRRLEDALAGPGTSVLEVPIGLDETTQLVEAAGEVVAWGGLD
jgi:acetolactate synthase-1/2/3 large subunit